MENGNSNKQYGNQNVSSTVNASSHDSMFPPTVNAPLNSTFSSPPPPYSDPSQYPPAYGLPYPQQYPFSAPVPGYSQSDIPPPGGQPYYPQQGVAYPGAPVFYSQPPQQQHHQQTQVVIVNNQPMGVAPLFVPHAPRVSMVGAIVLSCIATWFCGILFGGIAFILAMVGKSSADAGDTHGAMRWRSVSIRLSIVAIVIGIVLIAVFAGTFGSSAYRYRPSTYYYYAPTYYSCYSYYYGYYYYCK